MDFTELIRDYLDDANSHLSAYDTALISFEKEGLNKEMAVEVLGTLHTLKGNSGMMGFEPLKNYIHQIETVIKDVLEGKLEFLTVLEGLLESANVIRTTLITIEKDPMTPVDLTEQMVGIMHLRDGNGHHSAGQVQHQQVSLDAYLGAKTDTIKVDFKRLDDLLNLVGELVIFKTRMSQIENKMKAEATAKPMVREFNESMTLIGKTVAEMQEGIMKIRMLPVRAVFSKFPRMVMDIARGQGKQVNVTFEGEDTELDKTVIDELGEPLLHVVRNAIDHGIEPREDRIRKGKNPVGKLVLTASQESNYIIIKVKDDGKGIDIEKIRAKAIEKGLVKEEDILTRDDILSLIFSAGFSTKDVASDISGRGIGLDVVNRNISKLNGQVTLDSVPDRGSTVTIKLPLSLAIIPALMAESQTEIYAIPLTSVDESVKIKESDIHRINNKEVIRLRDKVLPILRLGDFFNLKGKRLKKFYLVVIRKGERRIALAVDRLKGQQDIVIKPLDDTFGKSKGVTGASILGDGRIVLIIDTLAFWDRAIIKQIDDIEKQLKKIKTKEEVFEHV